MTLLPPVLKAAASECISGTMNSVTTLLSEEGLVAYLVAAIANSRLFISSDTFRSYTIRLALGHWVSHLAPGG